MITLIGKKIGMTQIFNDRNLFVPITVVEILKNVITCIKNKKRDGYCSVQLTTGFKKKLSKSELFYFSNLNIVPGVGLWEVKYNKNIHFKVGQIIDISLFDNTKQVDVIGISKGKGFCGTIKRWNFKSQDKSHGNSLSHRAPGSIGQNQTPGRVFKGKKMSGHMGNDRVTIQKLNIVNINKKNNCLLLKGSVPGYNNSYLIVRSSIKNSK